MTVKITPNTKGCTLKNKLADAELEFTEGPLAGLRLLGFAIWATRDGLQVTFPARTYRAGGMRVSFDLLRPAATWRQPEACHAVRDAILAAWAEYQAIAVAS